MPNQDSSPVYRQIEQSATTAPPAVYQLLTFYHGLKNESDLLTGEFIPMTAVQPRSPDEVKIFAIGLIPPSVSSIGVAGGGALDRSATVAALEGTYEEIIDSTPDVGSSSTGDTPGQTSGLPTSRPVPVGPTTSESDDFYTQFVVMCNRLGCQPEDLARVIQTESSWIENNVAERGEPKHPVAKGLIQLIKKTALDLGMSEDQYANFQTLSRTEQLPWIEKFYKGRARGKSAAELKRITFGGFNNSGDERSIYHSNAVALGYKRGEFQQKAYEQNKSSDKPHYKGYITADDLFGRLNRIQTDPKVLAGIQRAKELLGMGAPPPAAVVEDAKPAKDWKEKGQPNKDETARTFAQVANKSLNQANLGKRFLDAQASTIRLMQAAINQIANTPPLRLLVNPQSFRVSAEKVIANSTWGRNGPVIEHWGENQDKIEGSGKISAFYSMDASNSNGPGLSRTARQFSASYQNLLSLFLLYRNNAGVWLPDPSVPSKSGVLNLSVVGSVYLYYDEVLYIGSFDSLTLSEAEGAPFTLEYTFSFTVRAWYLLDHLDDPRYTYNAKSTPGLPTSSGEFSFSGQNPQPAPSVPPPPPPPLQSPFLLRPNDDPLRSLFAKADDNLEGIET